MLEQLLPTLPTELTLRDAGIVLLPAFSTPVMSTSCPAMSAATNFPVSFAQTVASLITRVSLSASSRITQPLYFEAGSTLAVGVVGCVCPAIAAALAIIPHPAMTPRINLAMDPFLAGIVRSLFRMMNYPFASGDLDSPSR